MKIIKLLNLKLVNFKGIKEFELDASGNDIKVYGDNATGKTTIFDAFVWLLFNKDSSNRSDFDIKTLVDGKPIHKLDHEVQATLLVDGTQLTLKKVYKEQWTKKRGSVTTSFSGHTTEYFINEVPSKKKEFDETIAETVDEEVFKLLTSPNYFNENIHWKERRDLLIDIAGEVTDEDVVANNKDLAKLLDALNGNSIDDHKKIIAAKRRDINKEIELIPVKISEVQRGMQDITKLDASKIKTEYDKISFDIEDKQEQINKIRSGSEVNDIKKKISDIELQIANVSNEHLQEGQQELYKKKSHLQEEESNQGIMRSELRGHKQQVESNESRIKDFQEQMEELRKQYIDQNSIEFDHENECVCPTCEQDLPEDKIAEATSKFNTNKSKMLERINERGVDLKAKVEELQVENESINKKIEKVTKNGTDKTKVIDRLKKEIEQAESNVVPVEENEQYIKLNDEKQALQTKVEELQKSVSESVVSVQEEIMKLKDKQDLLQQDLNTIKSSKESQERIAELEAQEKKLASEYEELEQQLYLTEEFTRTKVNMLTENINNKFKHARFNLFKENINGGLEEICETTYQGVPYSSGLNNAARINVGLDIINTLSTHYGVQAPIFVDNAESVTSLIDIESQVISLVVSENDKELRIETESEKESEVA